MRTGKRVVIHVGIHKTGLTSIQEFLRIHRTKLRMWGFDFYLGQYLRSNHVELHLAAMRPERTSPFKLSKGIVVDKTFQEGFKASVSRYITRSPCHCLVFSAEGLSYLRYEDEMNRLRAMVPGQVEIVIYLRNATSFLASYKNTIKDMMPATIDRDSFAYTGHDSWLVDFESRLAGFRNAFGVRNVTVLDYDHELRTVGNTIPSFLKVLGVERYFDAREWSGLFLNRTQVLRSPTYPVAACPPRSTPEERVEVMNRACSNPDGGSTKWNVRKLADACEFSKSSIHRILNKVPS